MVKTPKLSHILTIIFISFFILSIIKAFNIMNSTPFHDFDEAHRAENAKRMKEYGSLFIPLTGSPYDRVEDLKIPVRENPYLHLYYHLERPPLIYDLMIVSTSLFGNSEFAYRLPSFLLGIGIIGIFIFFAKRQKNGNIFALAIGLSVLISSKDLWLSSQSAQMDTGITFFLFLSLMTLIYKHYFLSGIFFGLSTLSKLQPAVIFVFPILYLLISKKLTIKNLLIFIVGACLIFLPWVLYLILKFGFKDVFYIIPGFALTSASIIDINHEAPFFWYARWWWESFRPGWTLFLVFFIYDLVKLNFSWEKKTILSYIIFGFLAFSMPINKLWWYILPLIPAVAYYSFLSVKDYLIKNPQKINNLSVSLILASLPMFLQVSNTLSMIYGVILTVSCFLIIRAKESIINRRFISQRHLLILAITVSLMSFYLYFPQIVPYHWNTKPVAQYYKSLPGQKCLFIGDMPTEAVLFYSNVGEVLPLQVKNHTPVFLNCEQNFLISPDRYKEGEEIFRQGKIRLYKLPK